MASGRTHARIAATGVACAIVASHYIAVSLGGDVAAGIVVGAVAGWLVTPDIDHHYRTHEERRIRRRLPVLGRLWQAYWAPYAVLLEHRGISHAPVIGTATRALYAFWWLWLLPAPVLVAHVPLGVAAFGAWCVQDVAHLAADGWRFGWKV